MDSENGWIDLKKHSHLLRVINMSNDIFELPKNDDIEKVENAFQEIVGRAVTDQEKGRLYKVRTELNINSEDPIWVLMLQLERYNSLYDAVPDKISSIVNDCFDKIKAATEDEIRRVELDIERKAFKASQAYATIENELLHQVNESTERIFFAQQKMLSDASAQDKKLTTWTIVGAVTLIQMLIIILTNSVTAIIASGNPKLPWIVLGEGSTRSGWLFQLVWNFPSGVLMTSILVFGVGYLAYDSYRKQLLK